MTPEDVIDLAAQHHVASESPLFNQQLVAFAAALEAATIERLAAWIEPQRNDVPATGKEFASTIRAIAKKEGT